MLCGEEIWWYHNKRTNDIVFRDGEEEPAYHTEGPTMMNFKKESVASVITFVKSCWDECIKSNIQLPIERVHLYNECGDFISKKSYLNLNEINDEVSMCCIKQLSISHYLEKN